MRSTKNISITMPTPMIREAERIAKRENRTMSELVREALRQYQSRNAPATRGDLQTVMQIIGDVKKNPMSPEELRAENARLLAYGAQQAKKTGIKERDITRAIHASRSRRRAS